MRLQSQKKNRLKPERAVSANDARHARERRRSGAVLVCCHPRSVVPWFCALSEPLHTARPLTMSATTMSFATPAAATTARAPVPRRATLGRASLRRSKSAALPRRRDRRAVLVRASGERVAVIGEALWVRATPRDANPAHDSHPTARPFSAARARTNLRPTRVPLILHPTRHPPPSHPTPPPRAFPLLPPHFRIPSPRVFSSAAPPRTWRAI